MSLTDAQLLEYNSLGLIPGPKESEEEFLKRAAYCLSLKDEIINLLSHELPFVNEPLSSVGILVPALEETRILYDCRPSWIPLFFSNFRLLPWHGGCAWIFQQTEESPTAAFLQLRRAFLQSETYLGLYSRKELIAHELCHVGRMCFEEPRFEEILAYRTSKSKLRRWLGAIAQSSWETTAFFLLLCLILGLDLYALYSGSPHLLQSLFWLKLLPISFFGLGFLRLFRRQSQFAKCLKNLREAIQDKAKAASVIYRLTDSEIMHFSKMIPQEIPLELEERKDSSLRWRLIHLAYLQKEKT